MKNLQIEVMEALERKSPREAIHIYQKAMGCSEQDAQVALFEINSMMNEKGAFIDL